MEKFWWAMLYKPVSSIARNICFLSHVIYFVDTVQAALKNHHATDDSALRLNIFAFDHAEKQVELFLKFNITVYDCTI